MHKRAEQPAPARGGELVNNCAAGENFVGGRPASARSQSQSPHPKRVIGRPLAEPEALAPTSNRKRPTETGRTSLRLTPMGGCRPRLDSFSASRLQVDFADKPFLGRGPLSLGWADRAAAV